MAECRGLRGDSDGSAVALPPLAPSSVSSRLSLQTAILRHSVEGDTRAPCAVADGEWRATAGRRVGGT